MSNLNLKPFGTVSRLSNQFNGAKGNNNPKSYAEQTADVVIEYAICATTIFVGSYGVCKAVSSLIKNCKK